MAVETRRPGITAGLSSVVHEGFGVKLKPTENAGVASAAIWKRAMELGYDCEALWLSDAPVVRGALFDALGRRVSFPLADDRRYDRCFVALVDPDRQARWTHDAYFAFMPADGGGEVEFVKTDVPAHSGGAVRLEPAEMPK